MYLLKAEQDPVALLHIALNRHTQAFLPEKKKKKKKKSLVKLSGLMAYQRLMVI